MGRMKPIPKAILILAAVGGGVYGVNVARERGVIPSAPKQTASVPPRTEMPVLPATPPPTAPRAVAAVPPAVPIAVTIPSPGAPPDRTIRIKVMAWNAQMGLIDANGGPRTTPESLVGHRGLSVSIERQDDTGPTQVALTDFATALAAGDPNPRVGAQFAIIMGNGAGPFLQGINPTLSRLGPDYIAQVVGFVGKSFGEDALWGPQKWKDDKRSILGAVITVVPRDGDWDLLVAYCAANDLPVNPDERTYDPNAVNIQAVSAFTDAAEKWIAGDGACEVRPVVGTMTKRRVCPDGFSSWTPADVTAAEGRGGLVRIVSTRDYPSLMPAAVIGIKAWMQANRSSVENLLDAAFAGADEVRTNPAALAHAAALSALVYDDKDGPYWLRYFQGATERDAQGVPVELGGSSVANLADNVGWFGLDAGGARVFESVYRGAGRRVVALYPDDVPTVPDPATVIDASYVAALQRRAIVVPEPARPQFAAAPIQKRDVVSRRSWHINFDTRKATFTPDAERTLQDLFDQLAPADVLKVGIYGYTDNTGNRQANQALSERRAFAVRDWLVKKAPAMFPTERVDVAGYGQDSPAAPNDTEAGKAQNRRVEIVLGRQS